MCHRPYLEKVGALLNTTTTPVNAHVTVRRLTSFVDLLVAAEGGGSLAEGDNAGGKASGENDKPGTSAAMP